MTVINILDFLDNHKISRYQQWIVLLMFLTVMFDGMDIVIMSFIIPALTAEWQLSHGQGARILSAALIGLIVGALSGGLLTDKIGRKKMITAGVFSFGLFTLLCATATNIRLLILYRFLAGMAMGAVLPQVATLVAEYMPRQHRAKIVTFVFSGFTIGASIGGFMSALIIESHGWSSVMVICGLLPLGLSLLLLLILPESIGFMVLNSHSRQKIAATLNRMHKNAVVEHQAVQFVLPPDQTQTPDNPLKIVLNSYFRFGSLTLWSSYFLGLLLVYLLGSWMPTIIANTGFTLTEAAQVTAIFQLGGSVGSIMLGWLMDRYEPHKILALNFILGILLMLLMSALSSSLVLLSAVAFLVSFCFNGGNTGMNALSSLFFPVAARATGNGWMHGIGRFGAVASTFVGAWMLDHHWSLHQVLFALSVPALLIALLLLAKWQYYRRKTVLKNVAA